jgi:hypothetical protein
MGAVGPRNAFTRIFVWASGTFDVERLRKYMQLGITRFSIGVQVNAGPLHACLQPSKAPPPQKKKKKKYLSRRSPE